MRHVLRLFFCLVFFLSSSVVLAVPSAPSITSSFSHLQIQYPQVYNDSVYAVTSSNTLAKLVFPGKEQWQLSQKIQTNLFRVHFNQIVLVDQQHRLHAYDANYGFHIWRSPVDRIEAFQVFNPYVLLRLESNALACVDFETGKLVWLNDAHQYRGVSRIGRSAYVAAIDDDFLYVLDITTGDIVFSPTRLPQSDLTILSSSNHGVFLQNEDTFHYALHSNQVLKLTVSEAPAYFFQDYYFTIQKETQTVTKYHYSSDMPVWSLTLESMENVFFQDTELLVFLDEETVAVHDLFSGDFINQFSGVPFAKEPWVRYYKTEFGPCFISSKELLSFKQ